MIRVLSDQSPAVVNSSGTQFRGVNTQHKVLRAGGLTAAENVFRRIFTIFPSYGCPRATCETAPHSQTFWGLHPWLPLVWACTFLPPRRKRAWGAEGSRSCIRKGTSRCRASSECKPKVTRIGCRWSTEYSITSETHRLHIKEWGGGEGGNRSGHPETPAV